MPVGDLVIAADGSVTGTGVARDVYDEYIGADSVDVDVRRRNTLQRTVAFKRSTADLINALTLLSGGGSTPGAPVFTVQFASSSVDADPSQLVVCDASGGSFTVTLPDATTCEGESVIVKLASMRYINQRVTVDTDGGDIDEAATYELGGYIDAAIFMSDGTDWRIEATYMPRKWVGSRRFNFKSHSNLTIVNGSNTIQDVRGNNYTFTGVNIGNATSVAIVNGTGLVFTMSTNNNTYFNASRTCPLLTIPVLAGLLDFYGCTNHVFQLSMKATGTNQNADFESFFLGVESSTTPMTQGYRVQKEYVAAGGGIRIVSYMQTSNVSTIRGANTTPGDDILSLTFEAPLFWSAFSGVDDASGYLDPDQPWDSGIQVLASPLLIENGRPLAVIGSQTNNATGSFNTTVEELQARFVEKRPFRNAA